MTTSFARIDPARCIGCTKCAQACPSGAVLGAAKVRHHIVAAQCNACGDCLPACPTTCISWADGQPAAKKPASTQTLVPAAISQPMLPALPSHLASKATEARTRMRTKYTTKTQAQPPKLLRDK